MPTPFESRYLPLGGVNNSVDAEFIKDEELSDSANYQPDTQNQGCIVKREGTTKENSTASTDIRSIYQGRNANYYTMSQYIRKFDATILDSGLTPAYPDWCSFATYDIFVNGAEARQTSDGATFAAVAGMPAGVTTVASYNNYLYYAGHSTGSKVGWFIAGELTYDAASGLTLNSDENNRIVALKAWKNGVLVLLQKSFQVIVGYSQYEHGTSGTSSEEGCTSHRSVVVTPKGMMWWSKAGPVMCSTSLQLDYPGIRKIPKTLAGLNADRYLYVHACHDPIQARVMFYVPVGTSLTNNARLDYYYNTDSWWLHSGAGTAMCGSGQAIVSGKAKTYCGSYGTAYLYENTGNTDDGTLISSYLETKTETQGSPALLKGSRKVTLTTNLTTQAEITYGCYLDGSSTLDSSWPNLIKAGSEDTIIGVNRQHRKIKHRISDMAATRTRITSLSHEGITMRPL